MSSLSRLGQCEFLIIDNDDLDTSNLYTHILEDESVRTLVTDRHPWAVTSIIDAETLLESLVQIAPAVAECFTPKSKSLDGLVFRLVNDLDRTEYRDDIEDETSYIAMSYCWKKAHRETPQKETAPIGAFGWVKTVESFPLPTTPAMFQAVLRQREDENEGLWFDQVCIDQDDEDEKAVTIGVMDSIYQNARTVVIALDDIIADDDEVAFLRYYFDAYNRAPEPITQQPNRGLRPPYMMSHPPFASFFDKVLSSVWFERAWCGHEMRLGKTHVFLVPCQSSYREGSQMIIRFTGVFFLHMLILSSEVMSTIPGQQQRKTALQQLFGRRALFYEREAILAQNPGVEFPPLPDPLVYTTTIAEVYAMKAGGNPRLPEYLRILDANRDKLSICLNTAGYPIALTPGSDQQPPNTEDECIRRALLVGLAAHDPVTLCTTGPPLQLHNGAISWLFRPTALDIVSAGSSLPRFPSMQKSVSVGFDKTAEYVQLDLIFLDLPHRHNPNVNGNWQHHIQRARVMIDLCVRYSIESYTMWSSWQTPGHQRAASMLNIFVQTLACCLACGPNWTMEVSKRFQIGNHGLNFEGIRVLFNPFLAMHDHILTPGGRQDITYLINFVSTLVAYGVPWASGATERSCGPMIVSFGAGGNAVIFAPFAYSKSLLVAIPDAVRDTDYDYLSRGWIVTAKVPTDNWVLRTKSVVFGDSTFNGNIALRTSTNRYRVFGPADG